MTREDLSEVETIFTSISDQQSKLELLYKALYFEAGEDSTDDEVADLGEAVDALDRATDILYRQLHKDDGEENANGEVLEIYHPA